jgi:hypothetical protein
MVLLEIIVVWMFICLQVRHIAITKNRRGHDRIAIRLFRIMSIPTKFRLFLVLTAEQIGRRLPAFKLLLWQRQHIIVVEVVDCN